MKHRSCGARRGSVDSKYGLMPEGKRHRGGFLKVLILFAILVAIVSGASGGERAAHSAGVQQPRLAAAAGPGDDSQTYWDGLVVDDETKLTSDVTVFSGGATIEDGGRIEGSLVVWAGDVEVEDGGYVGGDLTAWAGDVEIGGRVEGHVSAAAGNVELRDGAWIGGDVSTLAGDIDKSGDAVIGGAVLRGKEFGQPFASIATPVPPATPVPVAGVQAPVRPAVPAVPPAPALPDFDNVRGFNPVTSFFALLGRLFVSIFLTAVVVLIAMAVYSTRPDLIDRVQDEMRLNLRRSFAVGIVTNGALYLVMRLLILAWCFAPLAIVPALALLALNAVGIAAVSRSVGQRFVPALRATIERKPVTEVALGALLIFGVLFVLAALLGWSAFWTVVALIVASPGVGALADPWLRSYRNRKVHDLSAPGGMRPVRQQPVAVAVKPVVASPVAPAPSTPASVRPVAPQGGLTAVAQPAATNSVPAAADLSAVSAPTPVNEPDVNLEVPSQEVYRPDPTMSVEDLVAVADAEAAARQDAASRAEQAALASVDTSRGDDFTRIRGLGRAAERKLKRSGIYTYAELAALPVEIIARVLGVPPEEVMEDQVIQQANLLVRGGGMPR